MAETETPSIREVLEEAVGKAPPEPVAPAPTEQPTSDGSGDAPSSSPTPPGEGKAEELLEPVDAKLQEKLKAYIADLPPEKQQGILSQLKNYDRHFHRNNQRVSEFRKFAEGLVQRFPGVTAAEMDEALTSKRAGPSRREAPAPTLTEEDIDALIEKAADPTVREELRKSKQVLHREMDKRLKEQLKPLQEEIESLKRTAYASRASGLEQEIDTLEDVVGLPASFVEKYREAVRANALKYHIPVKEALKIVVPFDELQEALANRTPTTSTPAPPKVSPARTVSAPAASPANLERYKERGGGWNIKGALQAMLPRARA